MDIEDDIPGTGAEIGSDELLSDNDLRLPESANMLVRVHAVRAWLIRRQQEARVEIGEAALLLQEAMVQDTQATRLRRRERQSQDEKLSRIQQVLAEAQERLEAFEEALVLLEDCIIHTSGERVLVEYYLALEDRVQSAMQAKPDERSPRFSALAEVQHRVEHVGAPNEEE